MPLKPLCSGHSLPGSSSLSDIVSRRSLRYIRYILYLQGNFFGAGRLSDVLSVFAVDEADAGAAPPLYMTSLCPIRMLSLRRLFHRLIWLTLHLYLMASRPSTSPLLTLWIILSPSPPSFIFLITIGLKNSSALYAYKESSWSINDPENW